MLHEALVYNGPRDVQVMQVPDATIERAMDVLVKITSTNICGSDLHMYEGRTSLEPGRILCHENQGEVIEVGAAVDRVKVGDRVCLPFNIGCGFCENCEKGLSGFCLTANPGTAGAAYGFAGMGPYSGGQAEYLRVPYGDFNCLVLPRDSPEKDIGLSGFPDRGLAPFVFQNSGLTVVSEPRNELSEQKCDPRCFCILIAAAAGPFEWRQGAAPTADVEASTSYCPLLTRTRQEWV